MLTNEERERQAYITGDTKLAELLAGQIDSQVEEIEQLQYAIDELKSQLSDTSIDLQNAEQERDEYKQKLENLIHDIQALIED